MAGPPAQLLSSLDQTEMIIKENPLTVVGVFKDLESKECKDFLSVADVLHSKYNFTRTLDSSCVPHTSADLVVPGLHLYKNFGEGFNDATVGFGTGGLDDFPGSKWCAYCFGNE
ncbi:unnamed protein product [Sphagnum balticum]